MDVCVVEITLATVMNHGEAEVWDRETGGCVKWEPVLWILVSGEAKVTRYAP